MLITLNLVDYSAFVSLRIAELSVCGVLFSSFPFPGHCLHILVRPRLFSCISRPMDTDQTSSALSLGRGTRNFTPWLRRQSAAGSIYSPVGQPEMAEADFESLQSLKARSEEMKSLQEATECIYLFLILSILQRALGRNGCQWSAEEGGKC